MQIYDKNLKQTNKNNEIALLDAKIMEIDPQVEHKTGKKHEIKK